MARTEKAARKLARDRYLSKLIDCIGAAVLAGYDEHARKMHEISLDILRDSCYNRTNSPKRARKEEENAMKYYEYGFYSESGEFFAIGEYGFNGLTLFTTAETAEQAENNFRDYVDSEYDKPEYTVREIDGIGTNHIEI